jgi:hypothetical protein
MMKLIEKVIEKRAFYLDFLLKFFGVFYEPFDPNEPVADNSLFFNELRAKNRLIYRLKTGSFCHFINC